MNHTACLLTAEFIEFITGLDRDFPSTVSTVSRTASKLTVHSEMDVNNKCAICLM